MAQRHACDAKIVSSSAGARASDEKFDFPANARACLPARGRVHASPCSRRCTGGGDCATPRVKRRARERTRLRIWGFKHIRLSSHSRPLCCQPLAMAVAPLASGQARARRYRCEDSSSYRRGAHGARRNGGRADEEQSKRSPHCLRGCLRICDYICHVKTSAQYKNSVKHSIRALLNIQSGLF
jgi:hypothetical protein